MRGDEGVHEGLEVRAPPLGKAVANVPIALALAVAQAANGRQTLIKPFLETLNLVIVVLEIVTRQLEERIGYLQHQNVWVVVLVANEDALAGSSHAMLFVMLLEPLESSHDRRVLLRLCLLDTERVVGQRVQADGLGLIGLEWEGDDGRFGGPQVVGGDR